LALPLLAAWVLIELYFDEGRNLRSREKQFIAQASFLFSGGSTRGRFGVKDDDKVEEQALASIGAGMRKNSDNRVPDAAGVLEAANATDKFSANIRRQNGVQRRVSNGGASMRKLFVSFKGGLSKKNLTSAGEENVEMKNLDRVTESSR